MPGRRVCRSLVLWLAICMSASGAVASTRVAIVVPSTTVPDVIAVAEASLSTGDSQVTLVERQAINKVLGEQQTAAALATGDESVAIGKLLSAQVMAVVEPSTDGKTVVGLVVFDAETGVRLEDTALPTEGQPAADMIAARIKAAIAKRNLPLPQRRTVCMLTVRNADLPVEKGGLARAAGSLIERRLTDSATVTVLERERLDKVNAERTLPTSTPQLRDLAASITSIELQVSRDGKDGIKLTCLLTDPAGKSLGSPVVNGPSSDLAKLTDASTQAICKLLDASPDLKPGDPKAEARRFLQEMRFRWTHRDRIVGLQDAEAAFALDPESIECRCALARAVVARGGSIICGFDEPESHNTQLLWMGRGSPQEMDESLALMARGADLLLALATSPPPSNSTGDHDVTFGFEILGNYVFAVGHQIYPAKPKFGIRPVNATPAQKAVFETLRHAYRRYRMQIQQPAAIAAVHDEASFAGYSDFLDKLLGDSFRFSSDSTELYNDVLTLIPPWLDLADKFDRVPLNPGNRRPRVSPTGLRLDDPIPKLLHDVSSQLLQARDREVKPELGLTECSDQQLEQLAKLFQSLKRHKDQAYSQASQSGLIAIEGCRRSRSHQDVPPQMRRAPVLLEAAVTPSAPVSKPATQPAFWKECRTLIDVIGEDQKIRMLNPPVVSGGFVYCTAFSKETAGPTLELLKFDVSTGKCTVLGQYVKEQFEAFLRPWPKNYPRQLGGNWIDGRCTLSEGNSLVRDDNMGLIIFPLDGGNPTRLDQTSGLPGLGFGACATLDGKLYAAVGDGILIAYDLTARTFETLASSRRKEHLTPFDDSPPFSVSAMVSDPKRNRILFCASSEHWPAGKSGLYELDCKTKAFRQLLPNDKVLPANQAGKSITASASSVVWDGDPMIMIGSARWNAGYDIAKDAVLPSPYYLLPREIDKKFRPQWPRATQGEWTWSAMSLGETQNAHQGFGRVSKDAKTVQAFPPLRPAEFLTVSFWPPYLQTIDDHRMLVGDQYGLWVVVPPDSTESAPGVIGPVPVPAESLAPIDPPSGGQLPWQKAKTIYDYMEKAGPYDFIVRPVASGDSIYAVGLAHTGPKEQPTQYNLQLLRFAINDGSMTALGSTAVKHTGTWPTNLLVMEQPGQVPGQRSKQGITFGSATAMAGDRMFFSTTNSIFEFPLDGTAARELFPANVELSGIRSIADLDGQLYFAGGSHHGSLLSRYDHKAGTFEKLVEEKNAAGPAPFDRQGVDIPFLAADENKHRIIFVACELSGEGKTNGIWSFDPATRRFTMLAPLFLTPQDGQVSNLAHGVAFSWGNRIDDHTLLLATTRGFVSFDLHADTAQRVLQKYPDVDVLAPSGQTPPPAATLDSNDLLNGNINMFPPLTRDNQWLWSLFPWSRISFDGKVWQSFPSLRSGDTRFAPHEAIQLFDSGKKILVADELGCWTLELKP